MSLWVYDGEEQKKYQGNEDDTPHRLAYLHDIADRFNNRISRVLQNVSPGKENIEAQLFSCRARLKTAFPENKQKEMELFLRQHLPSSPPEQLKNKPYGYSEKEYSELLSTFSQCLLSIHSLKYLKKLERTCKGGYTYAEVKLEPYYFDIFLQSSLYAFLAALFGDFACIRPSGHHARREEAKGFGFINNAAVMSQLFESYMILDIDVHGGDGTMSIHRKKENALVVSIEGKGIYGSTEKRRKTKRTNSSHLMTIALDQGTKNEDYYEAISNAFEKMDMFMRSHGNKKTKPALIISAGFDTFTDDPHRVFNLTKESYKKIGKMIGNFAQSHDLHVAATLEGGYSTEVGKLALDFWNGVLQGKYSASHTSD